MAACRRAEDGLARVGGRPVTAEALRLVVEAQTGKPFSEAPKELVATLFEGLLEEEVLLAAGGVAEDSNLPPAARSARVRELMATLCPPPRPPSDAEVQAWLSAHPGTTQTGDRLHLRQLILSDEAAARGARERVQRGEDFVAVSKELSRAPNAADGGMLGWFEKGQLTPEFEAVVFALPAGGLSEPVASNAGWHVFQAMERRAASAGADPGEIGRARAELGATKAEVSRKECVRRLALQVGVEVRPGQGQLELTNPFEGESK
jgi:parvulin-like peptidyl-prolyl isomerase